MNKVLYSIILFVLVFTLVLTVPYPYVHALSVDDLPFDLSNLPSKNYSTDYYLLLNQGNNYWLFHFENIDNVYVNMSTTLQITIRNSPFDSFVFDTTKDTTWRLYGQKQSNLTYTLGSQSYNYSIIYSTFDVMSSDGTVYHEKDNLTGGAGGEIEPTTPSDPTIPPDSSDNDGADDSFDQPGLLNGIGSFFDNLWQNISNFFTGLFDGFKNYLAELFEPVTSFFKDLTDWKEHAGSIGDIWNSLEDYTSKPIEDFMDSLNIDTIAFVTSIWELPIIKDIMMAIVAIMVLGAIVIFLGGGI